jgi:hypothetical protein
MKQRTEHALARYVADAPSEKGIVGQHRMKTIKRSWLASPAAYWGIVTLVSGVGAVWLVHTGPVPAIRIMTPLKENAPFWYMISPFPVLGMLVAELVGLIATQGMKRVSVGLGVAIGVQILVSHLRLGICLPISGHAALLSYFTLRRALVRYPHLASRKVELWLSVVLWLVMSYMKLVSWTDPITLSLGALIGALIFILDRAICSHANMEEPQQSPAPLPRAPSGHSEGEG